MSGKKVKERRVETIVDEDGTKRVSQVRGDDERDVAVGQVVKIGAKPVVDVPGFGHVPVKARTIGLVTKPGDFVLVARVRGGFVVLAVVEVLGGV